LRVATERGGEGLGVFGSLFPDGDFSHGRSASGVRH
jgi:hypothetical protein